MAAKGGDSSAIYSWQGNGLKNKEGQFLCNYKGESMEVQNLMWALDISLRLLRDKNTNRV